jgi:type I restriction enzyme S subunit
MTSNLAHYPLSELVIERPKSKIKVRDSSEIGPIPFYTSGIKIARHTESLCTGENIYIATGGKANFQFLDGPAAYSTDTYVVTGNNRIDTKYLYYFLTSQTEYIDEHLFRGAALRHLSRPEFKALQVPLPSLPEQQRIVHLLDDALERITIAKANTEKNLQNSRALFHTHLQAIFTQAGSDWARRKLNDLVEVQNGYAFSSKEYSDSGHFLMRIGNVQTGLITTSDPKFVRIPTNDPLQRFTLKSGDVLVSLTGNVGRVGVIKEEHLPAALNQRVARISLRKNSPALKGWVLHFLFSDSFRNALNELGHGTAQKNVSTTDLVNITIPVPDEPQQLVAIRMLDELRNSTQSLTATYQSKLEALGALENSLLSHAFHDRMKVSQ